MASDWKSYDSAASTHDRLVTTFFEPPARELVEKAGVPTRARLLDVGAGTGIAGYLAMERGGPETFVVALDPALGMLRMARVHGLTRGVAGTTPGLPFRDATFDRVLGNFVLSHVKEYEPALRDMVRVLRPGGKLGVTTWGTLENECRQRWQAVADSFAGRDRLQAALREALPWEEWFQEAAHLQQALEAAGLVGVEVYELQYRMPITIAEFLASREASLQGRFMREILSDDQWQEFKQIVSREFARFQDPLEHERDVHIGVGCSPSSDNVIQL
jgi:SAM-dependent methyltransferase